SNFARLPRAELKEQSLREFLHDCSQQLAHLEDAGEGDESSDAANVDVAWQLPEDELRAPIDKQMLRRVIVNLVRNSVQAIRDAHTKQDTKSGEKSAETDALGHVRVSAKREGTGAAIVVEDDGPGIPNEALARVFDPYFTTKHDGSGLGLAIVKKIVVEHGGTIDVGKSTDLGGARFVMHMPRVMPRDIPDAARSQPVLSKTG
ncbi:MAG: sensor histidine kinase, partial [Polyangiaceae bacterium]